MPEKTSPIVDRQHQESEGQIDDTEHQQTHLTRHVPWLHPWAVAPAPLSDPVLTHIRVTRLL